MIKVIKYWTVILLLEIKLLLVKKNSLAFECNTVSLISLVEKLTLVVPLGPYSTRIKTK